LPRYRHLFADVRHEIPMVSQMEDFTPRAPSASRAPRPLAKGGITHNADRDD
jgi:hypothetical protein